MPKLENINIICPTQYPCFYIMALDWGPISLSLFRTNKNLFTLTFHKQAVTFNTLIIFAHLLWRVPPVFLHFLIVHEAISQTRYICEGFFSIYSSIYTYMYLTTCIAFANKLFAQFLRICLCTFKLMMKNE